MTEGTTFLPLIYNTTLLMAMVVIYDIISSHDAQGKGQAPKYQHLKPGLLTGFSMGIIGILIIITQVEYGPGIIFDTRSVLISLTALYFGNLPLLVTLLVTSLFRIIQGGPGWYVGLYVILVSGAIGYLWRHFLTPDLKNISGWHLLGFGFVVHAASLMSAPLFQPLDNAWLMLQTIFVPVMIICPLATVLIGKLLSMRQQRDAMAQELQKKEQGLRIALSASNQVLFELNLHTGDIFSISEQETQKRYPHLHFHDSLNDLMEDLHPEDRDNIKMLFDKARAGTLDHWRGSIRERARDGSWVWFHVAVRLSELDESGRPLRMQGTFQDINDLKQAQLALAQEAERRRILVNHSSDGIVTIDQSGKVFEANRRFAEMLGYTLEEVQHLSVWDWDVQLSSEELWLKLVTIGVEGDHFETRHRRKDGTEFEVDISTSASIIDDQKLIFCVCRDITTRKQTEEALRVASLVYQNSREAMMVTDADNRIIDVNPTFTWITGYDRHEVVGKTPSILQSGRQSPDFYKEMWTALKNSGHWSGEIWNRRKNGEVYPQWLAINAVYDKQGALHRWVAQFSDLTEKKDAEQQIWQQANFDPLTGLPNRRMFRDRLHQELKRAHRSHTSVALLFLDLDHFKEVNDSLGHDMGDLLLKEAASRLQSCVRESDTIARLGGDEFIIILNDLQSTGIVGSIAQKILTRLATPFTLKSSAAYVSASIGITLYPEDADNIEGLMKNADQAMYAAKKQGRNRYSYFTPAMQEQMNRRIHITNQLRVALNTEQIWVVYQPVIDLASGKISKVEALVRWEHPEEGVIAPNVFIPIAEESGLITLLGNRVFQDALTLAKRWCRRIPGFKVSVNRSPVQFSNKEEDWLELLHKSGLHGDDIIVEITEGLLLDNRPGVQEHLLALKEAGIQVAIDDFGTGYSSLAYLKKFDINYLKIDQSFVQNLAPGNQDQAICEAMITMAHRLGLEVVAEGVETKAQRDLLMAAGCDFGQGYLFSHPLPKQELEELLERQLDASADSSSGKAREAQ